MGHIWVKSPKHALLFTLSMRFRIHSRRSTASNPDTRGQFKTVCNTRIFKKTFLGGEMFDQGLISRTFRNPAFHRTFSRRDDYTSDIVKGSRRHHTDFYTDYFTTETDDRVIHRRTSPSPTTEEYFACCRNCCRTQGIFKLLSKAMDILPVVETVTRDILPVIK